MDFPEAEELEWLESNSFQDEFLDDLEFQVETPSPPSSPELVSGVDRPLGRPTLSLPPKPSPFKPQLQTNGNAKKRFRYDFGQQFGVDSVDADAKRSKVIEKELSQVKLGNAVSGDLDFDAGVNGQKVHAGSECPAVTVDEEDLICVENEGRGKDDEEWLRYSPPKVDTGEFREEEIAERILSRYASEIDGECLPVTGLDGERVYAKLSSIEIGEDEKTTKLRLKREGYYGLLQEPVRVLMEKIEQEEFNNALQASVKTSDEVVIPEAPVTNEKLWVDKYAPNSFTELLSAEQTNREVLLWLKQWDSCVFGSEIKSTNDNVLSDLRRHSSGSQHYKKYTKIKGYYGSKREERLGRDAIKTFDNLGHNGGISECTNDLLDKRCKSSGPPEQKILLLCGPPGLGKTTLAHVAARHCGYRVVEINASDDRSSSTIETKIIDVVHMNSVIADSKPKCLIIDEIDGALNDGKGAVEVILRLVTAETKKDKVRENKVHEESGRKSSQKKKQNSSLLRPVICICNDLYAPALRPLRQVAKVHIFVQPTMTGIVNRLKYICNKERVTTSSIALTALAEYTDCDIRSCLNTLQFLNKKKEILNVLEIGSQVVGRKDISKSAFDVWKEIFQKEKEKRIRKSKPSTNNTSKSFDFLYSLVSDRGDYDLIMEGIHENILQMRYVDPLMKKTVNCLDNLLVSDANHRYIMGTQKWSLQVYQPPIAISIHGLVAQLEKLDVKWPKSFQRHRSILAERIDMFNTWHNKVSPCISRHLSSESFVENSISPMLRILSPATLRPVALHLLSEKEKSDLDQLVNTMVSYWITYKNIKSDRPSTWRHEENLDTTTLSFDPPISNFINFKDYSSCHFDLAVAVKQVLVHEVEKQKIMRSSLAKSTHHQFHEKDAQPISNTGTGQLSKSSLTMERIENKIKTESQSKSKSSGLSLSSNSTKKVEKTRKFSGGLTSFFDRCSKTSNTGSETTNTTAQKSATIKRDLRPLLFKFNEGFTNAVKRPVRVLEFLF